MMKSVKGVTAFLFGKEGQGTLKVHMVRGTVGTLTLKATNTVLIFGTSLLLARLLGAKEYGVYAYATSWAQLLAIPAVMGFNTLLVREVARYKTLENWIALWAILRWSDRVVLAASIGLAALFALGIWALRGRFGLEVRTALWLAMALVPLLSFMLLRQGALQGLGYIVKAQLPQLLVFPSFSLIAYTVIYGFDRLTSATALLVNICAGILAIFIFSIFFKRQEACLRSARYSIKQCTEGTEAILHPKQLIASALHLMVVNFGGTINQYISVAIAGTILGAEQSGYLTVALKISGLIIFALASANAPFAPLASQLIALQDKVRLQSITTKVTLVSFLGAILVCIIIVITGRNILRVWGVDFSQHFRSLLILSTGQLINAAVGPVALLLNMSHYEHITSAAMGISVLCNILCAILLGYHMGLEGIALAYSLSVVIWNAILASFACRKTGIQVTIFSLLRRLS